MNKYVVTCPNDGFKVEVNADTKEDAARTAMNSPTFSDHAKTTHPDLANKTPEEMLTLVMGMVEMAA